ncbi:hypothetical protein CVT24_010161 [Panaeolus cyanescens]|uniref:Uncharacterized protein n=1 Tax=Panaeolus cyanescens TaxID=181874 RepID=A0A409YW90_9AGAR|nr:hypothetical protein CVT24_010161 [Panaeolus cyanescens]
MTVQSHDDNHPSRVSVAYHNTPSAPISPPRPPSTPSRPPLTPKSESNTPYQRARFVKQSSSLQNERQLTRHSAKVRDEDETRYWFEVSTQTELEYPMIELLKNAVHGDFFVNWVGRHNYTWRYDAGKKNWDKVEWGDREGYTRRGEEGPNSGRERFFAISPAKGVPTYVAKSTYMHKYRNRRF